MPKGAGGGGERVAGLDQAGHDTEGVAAGLYGGNSDASSPAQSDHGEDATMAEADAGALALQLLLASAHSVEGRGGGAGGAGAPAKAVRMSASARAARAPAAGNAAAFQDTLMRPQHVVSLKRSPHDDLTAAKLVHQAETSRLDSWDDIEFLLRDDTHAYANRPALCSQNWGVYRESPKVPRRGKGGQRDLWTNSGGLRGATVWPAVESGQQPRVRRQYGKIKRVGQNNGQSELKFLEYSLVDDPRMPLSASLLQRRLFQTLPIDSMGVKAIKPMRATIEVPAANRTIGQNLPAPSRAYPRPPRRSFRSSPQHASRSTRLLDAGLNAARPGPSAEILAQGPAAAAATHKAASLVAATIPDLDALDANLALNLLKGMPAGTSTSSTVHASPSFFTWAFPTRTDPCTCVYTAGVFGNGSELPRRPQNLDPQQLEKRDKKGFALLYKEDRRIGFARR